MKGFVPWITLLFLQSFPPSSLPRHLTNETPAAWQLLAAPCSAARRPSQKGPFLCEVLLDFSDQPPFQQEGSTDACALLPCVPGPALQMQSPRCWDAFAVWMRIEEKKWQAFVQWRSWGERGVLPPQQLPQCMPCPCVSSFPQVRAGSHPLQSPPFL